MAERKVRKVDGFDLGSIAADTGILATKTPGGVGPLTGLRARDLRFQIAVSVATKIRLTATKGATVHKWVVNGDVPLPAESIAFFQFLTHSDPAILYDLEVVTGTADIESLLIEEIVTE